MSELPVVFQYQQALDEFRRLPDQPAPLLKRMSELISLLDLTTTLGSDLTNDEILEAALLIVMGELQTSRGGLFVRGEGGSFELRAGRGLPAGAPREMALAPTSDAVILREEGRHPEVFAAFGLEVLCPIARGGRTIALFGLGARGGGRRYGPQDAAFLHSVSACAATPIENGLIYHELQRVNRRLSLKVFQLNNLFDISRELTGSFDEEAIQNLVATTLMGQLMVSRCAFYLRQEGGFARVQARGLRGEASRWLSTETVEPGLAGLHRPSPVSALPAGLLRERLAEDRMALVVPLAIGERTEGFLAVGERVSGVAFSEEDFDFALTLARQAQAALESVRLQRVRLEKLRQDRELQIAREIQRSLFPRCCPHIPGFTVAAESEPCREVGGDHYDLIPLPAGRYALAIADVSGKGTPASILMASVHASLRALAGGAPLHEMMARLNRFLYESTQPNKYVTLFYGELDAQSRRFRYVNGGHVPPYLVRADGERLRLTEGGPALGLLEEGAYEVGEVALRSGDRVALVTDGATEALNEAEEEFGDERLFALLDAPRGASPALDHLLQALRNWTGPRGCTDDLTALVLEAV